MNTTNEKRTTTTTCDATSTGSTSTRTRARELVSLDQAMDRIAEMYADVLGRSMPRFMLDEVELNLQSGYEADWYIFALKETASAPHPSWRYVMAIVKRLRDKAWNWIDINVPY